ncbi:hypothetical protein FISHEDRAFT_48815 [Fistulina hepatica ATCC 64428]|uniref:Uncharacterized protein n=1 Tax=Fistulina hepatica ATCC 64428 TaxID=1128425 RepID=A0A0D7A531_9AGAR|nr:hypothetical protein FISHEDRAFT_48815 [Fistulina hepatica ATCC 64428]
MTSDFDFYDPFRSALYSCAEVQVCKTVQALVAALIGPSSVAPPAAVLLTEPTLVERKRRRSPVHAALSDYVHKKGGRVVFACSFSSFVTPPDLDSYFKDIWALPWRFGSYQRTVHHLQPNHPIVSKTTFPKLPNNYSMKTVDLKGVKPEDCVYMPSADSRVQSMVFAPRLVEQGQPGAAMTLVGSGWVGWVGDVNAEEGSTEVLLAMMGLKH